MTSHPHPQLQSFLSLGWYDTTLRFVFTFVAKTSELLLAAGLVVSTANFLTDGSVMATHPGVSTAWAWAQALAIDSSLGVCLYYAFQYLKEHEWIKGGLYGLLTLLLALVAGEITTIDIVSHALHVSLSKAMQQMVMNVTLLSQLRAIAVVGFLLMSRLRDVPFNGLLIKKEPGPLVPLPDPQIAPEVRIQQAVEQLFRTFSLAEVVQILNACASSPHIAITTITPQPVPPDRHMTEVEQPQEQRSEVELVEHVPPMEPVPSGSAEPQSQSPVALTPSQRQERQSLEVPVPSPEPLAQHPLPRDPVQCQSSLAPGQRQEPVERAEEKLERIYQQLLAEGKKPSGRALAQRAHIHRSTCVAWLHARQHADAQRGERAAPEEAHEAAESDEPPTISSIEPP